MMTNKEKQSISQYPSNHRSVAQPGSALDWGSLDQNVKSVIFQWGKLSYPHGKFRCIPTKSIQFLINPHEISTFFLACFGLMFLCAFTIHDGDTITKISYRLAYIDAPELNQTCHIKGKEIPIGIIARDHLAASSNMISDCRITGIDRYGRLVADCPFNMLMVRDGMAICYDQYIKNEAILNNCHDAQDEARTERRGLWVCDDFVSPAVWRKR